MSDIDDQLEEDMILQREVNGDSSDISNNEMSRASKPQMKPCPNSKGQPSKAKASNN